MPIYMDRHEIAGLSAEDVAEGHKQDLLIQHKYNCRALTYWFDETKGLAFCLVEAPDKKAVVKMHEEAHGLLPNQIIEVKTDFVETFLGRIKDPEKENISKFIEPASRTFLVAEIKDKSITSLISNAGKNLILSGSWQKYCHELIKKYSELEIKYNPNGFTAVFNSALKSVECALEFVKNPFIYKKFPNEYKINTAIGICSGEPVTDNPGIFGEVIQKARHLSYIAAEAEIVVSSSVNAYLNSEKYINGFADRLKILLPEQEYFLNHLMQKTERIWDKEDITVNDLCNEMNLSKSQLNRKMKALTGKSPANFIKDYRLHKTVALLEKHKGNIAQVAYDAGFNSASYFTKTFRKKYGQTPSEFLENIFL